MKVFILKLKDDLKITVDGQKRNFKKGFEIVALTMEEFRKYAPYSETQIIDVDDSKLLKLIKSNLKKLGGVETNLSGAKVGQAEADARLEAELERRKKLADEVEEEEIIEDDSEDDEEVIEDEEVVEDDSEEETENADVADETEEETETVEKTEEDDPFADDAEENK